jgi:transcriptional regulator GlxA family with amidase domain
LRPLGQSLQDLSSEREIVVALLELQPSNIAHYLSRAPGPVLPAALRRAVGFIHAGYDRDLTLNEIAQACDLHPRSLQVAFRQAMGVSPMAYLKALRLDAARYLLSARRRPDSVTDVALGCGFSHLGRFSRDYRARFGHSPSDRQG